MVFDAHARAFEMLGGVTRRGIYDNMKTAVDAVFMGKERRFNSRFQERCSHYVIDPVACTPASGWEKGEGPRTKLAKPGTTSSSPACGSPRLRFEPDQETIRGIVSPANGTAGWRRSASAARVWIAIPSFASRPSERSPRRHPVRCTD